jgi:hypothetical protein
VRGVTVFSRAVLLSLLLFPGAGQLALRRPWRALAFAGASVLLLAAVVRRVMSETARLLPTDPDALLDPSLPLRLAVDVHRANASFFLLATLGVVAVWAASVVDAWRGQRP